MGEATQSFGTCGNFIPREHWDFCESAASSVTALEENPDVLEISVERIHWHFEMFWQREALMSLVLRF